MANIEYSLLITILYASIYGTLLFITSIVCAAIVIKDRKNKKLSSSRKSHADSVKSSNKLSSEQKEEAKQDDTIDITLDIKDKIDIDNRSKDKWYSPIKEWAILVKEKKKVYLSLVPLIFDQATDYGVIYQYYELWQQSEDRGEEEIGDADPKTFFYLSVFVILLHRIISTVTIYRLTRRWTDFILQALDLAMIRAIWVNYKMKKCEPSNPQRFLEVLEATFESAPQILISTTYILKATSNASEIEPIIIVSVLFSLWTLTARVTADDKQMIAEKWGNIEFKHNKMPCMNWRYLFRVILWRFMEVTNRVFICVLIWVNVGGLALAIIFMFEAIWCAILAVASKAVDPLSQLMYLSFGLPETRKDWLENMYIGFWLYRLLSSYIYLVLVTIFATVNFEAAKVEEYDTRKRITITNEVGMILLVYTWITSCIWPCTATYIVFEDVDAGTVTARDLRTLIEGLCFEDTLELMEFGAVLKKEDVIESQKDGKRSSLYYVSDSYNKNDTKINVTALIIIKKVVALDPTLTDTDHLLSDIELECKNGGSLIHLAVVMPSIDDKCCSESTKVLRNIIDAGNVDINSLNDKHETALHYIVKYNNGKSDDVENMKILLNNDIDINIKDEEGYTAEDSLSSRTDLNDKDKLMALLSK